VPLLVMIVQDVNIFTEGVRKAKIHNEKVQRTDTEALYSVPDWNLPVMFMLTAHPHLLPRSRMS